MNPSSFQSRLEVMSVSSSKPYKLPKVAIRMVKEPPLYSSEPVNRPGDAVRLVREMLQSYDREAVVIVNLDTRAKPINFNVVSVGTLNASLAHPREIMKSAVLSNAASVMLIHNHPSGSIEPSADDIRLTNNMYSVCRILEIPPEITSLSVITSGIIHLRSMICFDTSRIS